MKENRTLIHLEKEKKQDFSLKNVKKKNLKNIRKHYNC